jgi:hypothetical protein
MSCHSCGTVALYGPFFWRTIGRSAKKKDNKGLRFHSWVSVNCKRNEIYTETKRNQSKRSEIHRNEIYRNEMKSMPNEINRIEIDRNETV